MSCIVVYNGDLAFAHRHFDFFLLQSRSDVSFAHVWTLSLSNMSNALHTMSPAERSHFGGRSSGHSALMIN